MNLSVASEYTYIEIVVYVLVTQFACSLLKVKKFKAWFCHCWLLRFPQMCTHYSTRWNWIFSCLSQISHYWHCLKSGRNMGNSTPIWSSLCFWLSCYAVYVHQARLGWKYDICRPYRKLRIEQQTWSTWRAVNLAHSMGVATTAACMYDAKVKKHRYIIPRYK